MLRPVLLVLSLGLFFSCSSKITSSYSNFNTPQKHDNAQLLSKAVAPVTVVSVSKTSYRTLRHQYVLYDVITRDKEGTLFVFASTEWGNLKPGDVIKYDNVIVGDRE